jgi:hypothetical protein
MLLLETKNDQQIIWTDTMYNADQDMPYKDSDWEEVETE